MSEIQAVLDRIGADAQAQADAIVASARERAEAQIAAANAAAEQAIREATEQAKREAEELRARKRTVAALEARKIRLAALTTAIDNAFAAALDALCAMPAAEYTAFVGDLLARYADEGDIVVLSAHAPDRKAIAKLPVFAKKHLVLSDEAGAFRGGVVLVGKTFDKQLSFEALLAQARKDAEGEVLARLKGA